MTTKAYTYYNKFNDKWFAYTEGFVVETEWCSTEDEAKEHLYLLSTEELSYE